MRAALARYLLVATAMAAIALAPRAASAASLSPAPPPDADCNTNPQGTVCRWSAPIAADLHNWNSVTCDGFTIDYTFRAQRDYTRFYDAEGNATKEIRHVRFSGTLYNSTDPSKTVPYEGRFTRTFDYGAETITFTGLVDHVIVPGLGAVNLDVGRSVRDATMPEFEDLLFSAGQWDANDATETPEELCRALS